MSPRLLFVVKSWFVLSLAVVLLSLFAITAQAAPPKDPAARLVKDALARQAQGTQSPREQLLQAALEQSPGFAPARWHLGYVKYGTHWLKYDEAAKRAAADHARIQYRKTRDKYSNTVAGQLDLAKWCEQRELKEEARAHYTKVLELDPENAEARAKLGFRRVDGVWLSQPEIMAARQRAEAAQEALRQWRPKLEALSKQLGSRNAKTRELAEEEVRKIGDPSAIPAMELVFSSANEKSAQLVVDSLSRMSAYEASLALARHSVFSPWLFVRQSASIALKDRPADHYVPAMLSAMYSPIQTRAELVRAPGGRLLYRHVFYREGQEQRELAVFDTEYERVSVPGGDGRETLGRAVGAATVTARAREAAIARQNVTQEELNGRICRLLAYTTSQPLPADTDSWWSWWHQYNDVFVAGDKPVRQEYRRTEIEVQDRSVSRSGGGGSMTLDCLAAGTKVWTLAGPMAIEKIQVGDQVLSQDPQTGELAYKPVLRTTIRPAGPLVKLETSRETIRTSGGHLFWVSGRGWVKARDLKPGDMLHTTNHVARLRSAEKVDAERTYNLVVADFHTYFVGEELILSHDNTVRQMTNAVVPGYAGR